MEQYVPRGGRASEITADVEAAVANGRAATGTALPPVRVLAATLGVSPGTVAAAYRVLAQRGIVEGRGRGGTWVRARPALVARGALDVASGLVDLARGNPDPALLPPLGPVMSALDLSPRLYGEAAVLPALAASAGRLLAADGIEWPALAVTGGALDAIERLLVATTRPGDRVAVEDPGYSGLLDLIAALQLLAEPVAVDRQGARPDGPDGLSAALHRGVAAVVLTPRAHNPTGAMLSAGRARALAAALEPYPDVLVIEDDHAGVVADAPAYTVSAGCRTAAVVRSFSKSLGPDLRLAIVAGDEVTVGRLEGRQLVGPGWVSHLLQAIVAGLLEAPATVECLARAARTYAERRRALVAALAERDIVGWGDSGLNVWVRVDDEAGVVHAMAEKGWAIAPGQRYRLASPCGVRLTTASLAPDMAGDVAQALSASLRRSGRTRSG